MIRPLLAVPSPRDIEIVQKALDSITGVDKLIVKYYYKYPAMNIITKFFADHKEYTHLAIKPDDLVSTNEHYQTLVKELEENDYPILSGVCNANMLTGASKLGICENQLPSIRRETRRFRKVDIGELPGIVAKQGSKIIKVKFAGLPFMFIRRDVLDKVTLEPDGKYNNISESSVYNYGQSYDVVFCNKLNTANIPIRVHTDVKMLHLKYSKEAEKKFVGIKKSYILFIDKHGTQKDITDEHGQPTPSYPTPQTNTRSSKISQHNRYL